MLEGGCLCGAVRYRVGGKTRVTHCHCLHCRKLGGAPYVTWVEAELTAFDWTDGTPAETSPRPGVTRTFCSACGSPLTYAHADRPGEIDVTAGTLDDPTGLTPDDHVWFDRRLPWVPADDGLPRFARSRRDAQG